MTKTSIYANEIIQLQETYLYIKHHKRNWTKTMLKRNISKNIIKVPWHISSFKILSKMFRYPWSDCPNSLNTLKPIPLSMWSTPPLDTSNWFELHTNIFSSLLLKPSFSCDYCCWVFVLLVIVDEKYSELGTELGTIVYVGWNLDLGDETVWAVGAQFSLKFGSL